MATLYSFSSYITNCNAKYVFKNTSGASNFFGFIGTNGQTLADQEVVLKPDSDVQFIGILSRAAISAAQAAGTLKFGDKGVTFYVMKADNGGYSTSFVMPQAGKVVGVYVNDRQGTTGTNCVATLRGTTVLSGTVTLPTAAVAAAEYSLSATPANLVCAPGDTLTLGTSAQPTSGHTSVVICAVAHHSA